MGKVYLKHFDEKEIIDSVKAFIEKLAPDLPEGIYGIYLERENNLGIYHIRGGSTIRLTIYNDINKKENLEVVAVTECYPEFIRSLSNILGKPIK